MLKSLLNGWVLYGSVVGVVGTGRGARQSGTLKRRLGFLVIGD